MKKHGLTDESARIARRHKAGSLGSLLGQSSPPPARDAKRDNVKKVCAMSREVQRRRKEAEESTETDFKLKQFVNVPSRLHQTPKRYTPEPPGGSGASPSTSRPRSASTPALSPAKLSPPASFGGERGRSAWARAPLRPCNETIQGKPSSANCKGNDQASPACWAGNHSFAPPSRTCKTSTDGDSFGKPRRLFSEESAMDKPGGAIEQDETLRPGTAHEHANGSRLTEAPAWWPAPEKAAGSGRPSARTPRASSCGAAPKATANPKASQAQLRRMPLSEDSEQSGPSVPQGYRLLPEEERIETLTELQGKLRELNDRYMRLPLKIETEGHRQQQQALREKIAQTERAEELFRRPAVLVEA